MHERPVRNTSAAYRVIIKLQNLELWILQSWNL